MTQFPEQKSALAAAAFFGFTAVLLGAFGAHELKKTVSAEMLAIFDTGCRYHLAHALALLGLAALPPVIHGKFFKAVLWCWSAGIIIFSGSLYLLVLTGLCTWGMITPLGGVLLMAGWLMLWISAVWRGNRLS